MSYLRSLAVLTRSVVLDVNNKCSAQFLPSQGSENGPVRAQKGIRSQVLLEAKRARLTAATRYQRRNAKKL